MPPILVHFNVAGWLSLAGLYLSLAAVLRLSLKARGVQPGELDSGLRLFLVIGALPVATLFLWAVAVIIHCDLIAPEACQPFGYLFHLTAR